MCLQRDSVSETSLYISAISVKLLTRLKDLVYVSCCFCCSSSVVRLSVIQSDD